MPTTYCRHIKTDGRRCCSPALSTRAFCYFHMNVNTRRRALLPAHAAEADAAPDTTPSIIHPVRADALGQLEPVVAMPRHAVAPRHATRLDLPPLEDRQAIQLAISELVVALGQDRIDIKRASVLLYGLQVASSNVKGIDLSPADRLIVTETELTAEGETIALDEDPAEVVESREFVAAWELEQQQQGEDDDEDGEDDMADTLRAMLGT